MKTKIFILLLVLAAFNLSAQEKIHVKKGEKVQNFQKGAYYVTPTEDLEKFVGNYISKEANLKLALTIEKTFFEGPDVYMNALVGRICDGDDLSEIPNSEKTVFRTTAAVGDARDIVRFLFYDGEKSKNGDLKLELLEGNRIKWTLKNTEGIKVGEYDKTFSVPKDAILVKT